MQDPANNPIELTVVAPAHNEAENIRPLVEQVGRACRPHLSGFEFIIVDDASTDATPGLVRSLMDEHP